MTMAIIFDTETTGLVENRTLRLDRQPYVTEFYGELVNLDSGEVKVELDVMFSVPVALDEKIIKITGITDEMLRGKPTFLPSVIDFLEQGEVAIAHNLSFDRDMIEIECERLARKIIWPRGLCTVEQTIGMKGYRLTLSNLHLELFGEPFPGSHRARADVKALTRCCVELRKRKMI
jgi:DNA polymerase III epsilon subunit-like protein